MAKELNFVTLDLFDQDRVPETVQTIPNTISEDELSIDIHLHKHIKYVIESLLFASSDPLSITKIREITDTIQPLPLRNIRTIIEELQQDYIAQQHAFRLDEIAEGYLLRSCEEYASYIDLLFRQKRGEKLSQAAAEVLAIIAYRQPITRPQVDAIRGVDSSGIITGLLERNLIESGGKLEAPGRPTIYNTTKDFLKHFGLRDIQDLKKFY